MSMEKHIAEFIDALKGEPGTLDAWLECYDEQECRDAILGAIQIAAAVMRERCAKEAANNTGNWAMTPGLIRALPGVTVEDLK